MDNIDDDTRGAVEKGNPDFYVNPAEHTYICEPEVHYIGEDKAVVELKRDKPLHWSEQRAMGYRAKPREDWELGDQLADHSDDQGWDVEDEDGK